MGLFLLVFVQAVFASRINLDAHLCDIYASPNLTRPDAFAVDPEDEMAILAFLARVVPMPDVSAPNAMRDMLAKVWRRFRPDLKDADLARRLAPYDKSQFALKLLKGTQPNRRIEIGRLRLAWLLFLEDISTEPVPDLERLEHRARALMVQHRAGSITTFLTAECGSPVSLQIPEVARAIADLHRIHALDVTPEPSRLVGADTQSRQAEVKRLWDAYLTALTSHRARERKDEAVSTIKFKHRHEMPDDPFAVPLETRWILEFLVLRFKHIKPREPEALKKYLDALREDYGHSARVMDLRPNEFMNVFYHGYTQSVSRLMNAWRDLLTELKGPNGSK